MALTKEPFLVYDPADQSDDKWILQQDFEDSVTGIFIPAGYKTNLASVPRILWLFIAPYELGETAALVHDWLYQHAGLMGSRRQADKKLLEIATKDGVERWKRFAAYYAVRFFAYKVWHKYKKENMKLRG